MHRDIHPKIKTPFHSYRSNIPAGTPIVTESKNIPIEHIQVDDKVLSFNITGIFNHQTNRTEVKKVTSIKSYIVSAIMALVFTTGDTLWATPNHPFWFDGQYIEAENLKAGDTLWAVDGSALVLENKFTKDTAVLMLLCPIIFIYSLLYHPKWISSNFKKAGNGTRLPCERL